MSTFFSWKDVSVCLDEKNLLEGVTGCVEAGSAMALMGPSGSGKTTLLQVLARRTGALSNFEITGEVEYNGEVVTSLLLREVSRFVEQEDHLIGSLTVKETVDFAMKFLSVGMSKLNRKELVDNIIDLLGLTRQANTKVGTPLQKGLSGGQKRRLSVASQVVAHPRVLFLDEPTSGLDSKASFEVVQTLKNIAKTKKVVVIASIHQPSTLTFELFDDVMFLSEGRVVYSGPRENVVEFFDAAEYPIPQHHNPAEYVLDLINTDFDTDGIDKRAAVDLLVKCASNSTKCAEKLNHRSSSLISDSINEEYQEISEFKKIMVLLLRAFIKARRDYLAYYVRIFMYLGLAIMMGTVWLRLGYKQISIQPFINAIFFAGAFMSFMSVAYIPAYLEDYFAFKKERSNGLYGPMPFVVANFIIGLPFLFFIVILFSVVTYFLCNFRHSATGFFMYMMYLFINLVAAESLTIFIATLFPVFVVALALTAFANGLWMAVGGFLVPASVLNVFWYYTFYWVNYQRYTFQGMMFNQFKDTIYSCGLGCQCIFTSELELECKIAGSAVLQNLGYGKPNHGLWIGVTIVLIFVLRAATYLVLRFRR